MGTFDAGGMRDLLEGLASNLRAFQDGLDAAGQSDVVTVVMSEFGRRVAQNGSGGTDHGFADVMTVMGPVNGGLYVDWPGVAPETLVAGDLAVTTDYRDVLWELVRDVLGHPAPGSAFPDHSHTPVGVTV